MHATACSERCESSMSRAHSGTLLSASGISVGAFPVLIYLCCYLPCCFYMGSIALLILPTVVLYWACVAHSSLALSLNPLALSKWKSQVTWHGTVVACQIRQPVRYVQVFSSLPIDLEHCILFDFVSALCTQNLMTTEIKVIMLHGREKVKQERNFLPSEREHGWLTDWY